MDDEVRAAIATVAERGTCAARPSKYVYCCVTVPPCLSISVTIGA